MSRAEWGRSVLICVVMWLLVSLSSPVLAQPTPPPDTPQPDASKDGKTSPEDQAKDAATSVSERAKDKAESKAPDGAKADKPAGDGVAVVDPDKGPKPKSPVIKEPEIDTIRPEPMIKDEKDSSLIEAEIHAEYRVRTLRISPLDLSGTMVRDMDWTEQRLRLDSTIKIAKLGAVHLQADMLDGVLFGDNGAFGGDPSSNSGVSLATRIPSLARWQVGLREGGDPLNVDDYVPVLVDQDPIEINFAYVDVFLPVGLLRIGRQPLAYGSLINASDGGRNNRWGVSQFSDAVDRVLFGTKLDEVVNVLSKGPGYKPDLSLDNGLLWALFYDLLKQDSVFSRADDLHQMGTTFQFARKKADWFGLDWRNFVLGVVFVYLNNERFDTDIISFPFRFETEIENVSLKVLASHVRGTTTEISEGFSVLTGRDPSLQELSAWGFQGILDVRFGPLVLTMEFDYAMGDDDPRSNNPITSFSFARDLNVGLLMFEHTLAFQSARSVAVGIENLISLDSPSFPLTEVQTDGRFTNAIAIFPQLYLDIVDVPNNNLYLRTGVLMAWPESNGSVDPVITTLEEDGNDISDDAVNFFGGDPGTYYGTEIDFQLGWRFKEHFEWRLEAAVLFPGSALQDENGDAVNSFLVENRLVLAF